MMRHAVVAIWAVMLVLGATPGHVQAQVGSEPVAPVAEAEMDAPDELADPGVGADVYAEEDGGGAELMIDPVPAAAAGTESADTLEVAPDAPADTADTDVAPAVEAPAPPPAPPPPVAPPPAAAAPPPSPAAAAPPPAVDDESVVLNFEAVDVREVIHSLADALGINYQIDPRIQGQVTIRTTGPIDKDDLFPIFNRILRSNGISAMRVGDLYQIVPVAEAKTKAVIPKTNSQLRRAVGEDGFIIEIFKVRHVSASEMVNVLQPFVTPGGDLIPYARSNLLIITDLETNVRRLAELIDTFDRDAFRELRARVYKIEHANIEEIGQELIAIMDTYGVTAASAEERGVYIIPLPRLNSVVVVAFTPTVFPEIERWIKVLDVPPEEGVGRQVHVFHVENAKASDLALILNELYGGGGSGGRRGGQQSFTPFATRSRQTATTSTGRGARATPRASAASAGGRGGARGRQQFDDFEAYESLYQLGASSGTGGLGGSGSRGGRGSQRRGQLGGSGGRGVGGVAGGAASGATGYVLAGGEPGDIFREEVRIVADEVTNSLVVLATRKDYNDIRDVLRRLDVVPRQVLVEALIAELTLGDDLQFGVKWAIAGSSRNGALGRITGDGQGGEEGSSGGGIFDIERALGLASTAIAPVPDNGMFAFISDNRNFAAVLNALASKNRLKVLSSPHIMTADNHEAHILVGSEVPIVTTQSNASNVQTDGTSNILQNIQYRDTGVILTVLPQVNSEGLVNMEIRQEVSQIASDVTGGIDSPTFTTRESETTVVVQSGETIVIGGIIDDTIDHVRSGIPFLMDIPVIGRVFRQDQDLYRRTELIILLTPHVVRDRQESRHATEAFRSRLEGIRQDIERIERTRPHYGGPGTGLLDDAGY